MRPARTDEYGHRVFFRGPLQDHGVEIFQPPREFGQSAQCFRRFLDAAMDRRGSLEIERFAGRLALALEFRRERSAARARNATTRPTSASYSSFVQPAKHGARHIFISE